MSEYYVVNKITGTIVNCVMSKKSAAELKKSLNYDWSRYDLDTNPSHHSLMEYEFYTKRP